MTVDIWPASWLNVKLGDVVDYGRTVKAEPADLTDDMWVLELEDIEKDSSRLLQRLTFADRKSKSTKNRFEAGDVLYGKLRPYLNKVVLADSRGVCSTEIVPLKPSSYLDSRYLFYWMKHPEFLAYVTEVGYGVNMPRLGTKDGLAAPFVLAPLAEQQEIAARLDTLLAQVDTLKGRLDALPAILKRFRQSLLAAAVSGKLTEEWREGNLFDLQFKKLGDTGIEVKTGPFGSALHKSDYLEGGIPVVNPMHINEGVICPTSSMTISPEKFSELSAWQLLKGDVVIGRRGEMGRAAVVGNNYRQLLCGTGSMILRVGDNAIPKYLELILRSPTAIAYFNSASVGSTMVNLNQKIIKNLEIHFPPIEEQTEIVRKVEELFAFADQVEQRVKDAQSRVNHLTQSILAKAFRGELTADWRQQHPELITGEHSAEALLARIQAERASQAPAKRTRKKKAEA